MLGLLVRGWVLGWGWGFGRGFGLAVKSLRFRKTRLELLGLLGV